jgi:hypothetical protein
LAAKSPPRRRLSAAIAAIERHNGPDDPRITGLRAELVIEGLAEHIRSVVDDAPPLTAQQRERLSLLLNPGTPGGGADAA